MSAAYTKTDFHGILVGLCGGGRTLDAMLPEYLSGYRVDDSGIYPGEAAPVRVDPETEKALFWHPGESGWQRTPALPFPFTAAQLAAFFLAGAPSLILDDYLDGDENLDESLVARIPWADDMSRRVLREAHALLNAAPARAKYLTKSERKRLSEQEIARLSEQAREQLREAVNWLCQKPEGDQRASASQGSALVGHAPERAPAISAPQTDRGRRVKRAALIEDNVRRWPTVERDLKDAATNGLSQAARDGTSVGWWWEQSALEWARARAKVRDVAPALSGLPSIFHSMRG